MNSGKSKTVRSVLFLCTGNSCRSQMAEAIVNAHLSNDWRAYSAGTQPTGFIHPLAVQSLAEIDIHHTGTSKSIDELPTKDFDLVITVCDEAAENCPIWPGQGKRIHMGFADPAKAKGTDDERLAVFRSVRDAILRQFLEMLNSQS